MSGADATVSAVEALMLEKFETEPFHNLHLLYGTKLGTHAQGGTCSDKTLSFLSAAREQGFNVALHSGFIGGKEIHRLVRVHVGQRVLFADVGNGWPALRLYPADRDISYRCFGMGFRTEVREKRVAVFHEKNGRESRQLEIDVVGRPEREISADIAARFSSGVEYPFSKSLRFSLIVGDRFLFLRGNRLEIHSESGFEAVEGVDVEQVPAVVRDYFGYDVRPLIPKAQWPAPGGRTEEAR